MDKTLRKFGYPASMINEYNHWYLLLRPEQVTIGSLILITKNKETNYSSLSNDSFVEFGNIVKDIEGIIHSAFSFDKINYLMLMMVDPEVHYHIIPRYSKDIHFNNETFKDNGWPGLPKFSEFNVISNETYTKMIIMLKNQFVHK